MPQARFHRLHPRLQRIIQLYGGKAPAQGIASKLYNLQSSQCTQFLDDPPDLVASLFHCFGPRLRWWRGIQA